MGERSGFDEGRFQAQLAFQDGVITRQQAFECGADAAQLRRWLRRRQLVAVYPGVYVEHTGPLTRNQREWAAVLDAAPAALSGASAVRVIARRTVAEDEPVHLLVDGSRTPVRRPGVVVHRDVHFAERILAGTRPPRQRTEEALLDLAAAAPTPATAVAILTDAVGGRLTTARRLLEALGRRTRISRRRFIIGVLRDIAEGTCSVLEHGYLTLVERPHGLPGANRQARILHGRPGFRDVDYKRWRVVVELDGRRWHDDARARDRDMERDLDAAIEDDRLTLRIGYNQVFDRSCPTGAKIARALTKAGWPGPFRRCPNCPE
ncbi:hypothetical protein [Gordonia sp. VNK21]|uniref:hypothetical protein n=1 Tax=Gordonia sp. VNK21 TaxID=3382483 RepID=UPI0038D4B345